MPVIDLHVHSSASDGTLSPAELVGQAQKKGLAAIGLTDHDTVSGLSEALIAGKELGIEVVPGCELSVVSPHGPMHILGYWVRQGGRLEEKLSSLRQKRHTRNEAIIEILQGLGVDVDYAEVKSVAGGESIGRPHLARVLAEKGYAVSVDDAFRRYLGSKGSAYVPKEKLAPGEALDLLAQEDALAVLAHPFSLELPLPELDRLIRELKEQGLEGIEAWYSNHDPKQTQFCLEVAQRYELLATGGSDFHGSVKPKIELGTGFGNLRVPESALQRMKEYRHARGLWV